jgi:hypothetical protein
MTKTTLVLVLVFVSACGGGAAGTKGTGGSGGGSTGTASTTASTGTGATTGTGTTTSTGTTTGGTGGASTGTTSSGMATSTGTGTSSGGGCTVTLSGSEMGTFSCEVIAAWSQSQNVTAVAFSPTSALPMDVTIATGGGDISGQIAVMDYPYADFVKGGYGVTNTADTVWASGPDKGNGPQTMNITSVTVDIDMASAKTYTLHGTFDATCPYVNGTPDPGTMVTVHIDF